MININESECCDSEPLMIKIRPVRWITTVNNMNYYSEGRRRPPPSVSNDMYLRQFCCCTSPLEDGGGTGGAETDRPVRHRFTLRHRGLIQWSVLA